jgi:hypothetical protein
MPYINDENDNRWRTWEKFYELDKIESPGDLNYLITDVLNTYLTYNGWSYTTMNDVIGALECAKMEFNRRIVVPYEDYKWAINGDVYPTAPPVEEKDEMV